MKVGFSKAVACEQSSKEVFDFIVQNLGKHISCRNGGHSGGQKNNGPLILWKITSVFFLLKNDVVLEVNFSEPVTESYGREPYIMMRAYKGRGNFRMKFSPESNLLQIIDIDHDNFVPYEVITDEDCTEYNGQNPVDAIGIVDLDKLIENVKEKYGISKHI